MVSPADHSRPLVPQQEAEARQARQVPSTAQAALVVPRAPAPLPPVQTLGLVPGETVQGWLSSPPAVFFLSGHYSGSPIPVSHSDRPEYFQETVCWAFIVQAS